MTAWIIKLRTLLAVGPVNVSRVLCYRLALRFGVHPVQRVRATIPVGPFFEPVAAAPTNLKASTLWRDDALLFGAHRIAISDVPPTWRADPFAPTSDEDTARPWWCIPDFAAGDIKRIWELSRFDWALSLAQRARNGEAGSLDKLNVWLVDWARDNPPYLGPNWKCAQEASIRVLHLSVAAILLGQERTMTAPLRAMIDAHIRRIMPTLSYARAQDNNHATSEASALFVAGAWATLAGDTNARALVQKGRGLLEQHVARLFAADGSFSQYSLNYHRFALDTLAIAEIWRQRANLSPFSANFRERAAAAAGWLHIMVDPTTGDAPNLGANDGAHLLPLTDIDFRDHRSSVQLAMSLFGGQRAYSPDEWDDALGWLGVAPSDAIVEPARGAIFDDGGYAVLRQGTAMALLRYPRFRFRPSQSDALHVDLWVAGQNQLRDGGSYSYNADPRWIDYFSGIGSHNSVQFDDQPQMPRLSRFLLGDWLKTEERGVIQEGPDSDVAGFFASYRHRKGWTHRREMRLDHCLRVIDDCNGFAERATLRWRLAPGDWTLRDGVATNGRHRLFVSADVPIVAMRLTTGYEARYYMEKTQLPVLEVTIASPGRLVSEYSWTK